MPLGWRRGLEGSCVETVGGLIDEPNPSVVGAPCGTIENFIYALAIRVKQQGLSGGGWQIKKSRGVEFAPLFHQLMIGHGTNPLARVRHPFLDFAILRQATAVSVDQKIRKTRALK